MGHKTAWGQESVAKAPVVHVVLRTWEDKETIQQAAATLGMSISGFVRRAALAEAKRVAVGQQDEGSK